MGTGEALLHFAGISLLLVVITASQFKLRSWLQGRARRQLLKQYAKELKLTQGELEQKDLNKTEELAMIQWLLDRFSRDLFRNRFSDFLGLILLGLNWIFAILFLVLVGATIFFMVDEETLKPVMLWWAYIPVLLAWILFSLIYVLICKLLTGRIPGQAKVSRKMFLMRHEALLAQKDYDDRVAAGTW